MTITVSRTVLSGNMEMTHEATVVFEDDGWMDQDMGVT
jgi:hypothetical protein